MIDSFDRLYMLSAIMNYTYFISSGIDSRVMVYLSSAILLEAVIGIVGNLAVLLIVVCYKDMHTLINLSFANLAVADLCVLSLDAIPTAMDLMGYNISSKLGCRIPYFIKWVRMFVLFSSKCINIYMYIHIYFRSEGSHISIFRATLTKNLGNCAGIEPNK